MRPDREAVHRVLEEKCRFKGISFPTLRSLEQKEPQRTELQTEWANMLAHQLPALPPFEEFWNELSHVFDWLAGVMTPPVLERVPVSPGYQEDAQWTPPPVAQAWGMRVPLEVIRFAGSNHLPQRHVRTNVKNKLGPLYDDEKYREAERFLLRHGVIIEANGVQGLAAYSLNVNEQARSVTPEGRRIITAVKRFMHQHRPNHGCR
jgi:hypothetical protein